MLVTILALVLAAAIGFVAIVVAVVRIPIQSGRVFRCEVGHRSGMKPVTIPT